VDECKTLAEGNACGRIHLEQHGSGRGLHSPTFKLNVSAFCGIQGAFMGCLGSVYEVSRSIRVYFMSETAQVEMKSGRV
jgi:hypothetical protein